MDIKPSTSTSSTPSHIYSAWITWKYLPGTNMHLRHLLHITETFLQDINLEFSLEKCKTLHIEEGSLREGSFILQTGDQIDAMIKNELYKCLGFQQAKLTEHKHIKCTLKQKYTSRLTGTCLLYSQSHQHICNICRIWSNTLDIHRVTTVPKETHTLWTAHKHHHPK